MARKRRRFTRRHWLREAKDLLGYAASSFEDRDRPGKLSQFREMLFMFAVAFVVHWPSTWDWPTFAALAVIVGGLPARDLLAAIPVAEAFSAARAYFSGSVIKRARELVTGARGGAVEGSVVSEQPDNSGAVG